MNAILAAVVSPSQTASNEPSASLSRESRRFRAAAQDRERDRQAEAALAAQRERVFSSSYLPAATGRFLIH
jgi:hypothetical protein